MNLNKIRSILFIALTVLAQPVLATTYYVDGDFGNDANNGKFAYDPGTYVFPNGPKATISAALTVAADGDIIEITGGNYSECIKITKTVSFSLIDHISVKCLIMDGVGKRAIIIGGRDFVVLDSLRLRNGIIDASGSNNNLVAGVKCAVLGGSRTSFVDNKLHRVNNQLTVTDLFYPVGTGSDYRPATISFKQSNMSQNRYWIQAYAVAAPPGTPPAGIKNISKVHYWYLRNGSAATVSGISYTVQYDSTKNDDEVFDPQNLRLVAYQPSLSAYINQGGAGTAKFNGTIKASNTSDTAGIFTLANISGGTNTLGRKEPVAKFGWEGKCVNSPVQFKDSSYSHKSKIIKWFWDFGVPGNTDTSTQQNPKFTYSSTGPWTVRLIVENNIGLLDTLYKSVLLKSGPKGFFNIADACLGKTMLFTDGSTIDPLDTITTRLWRMGDGSTRTGKSFGYTYSLAGKYTVQLILTSTSGCIDTFKKDINIFKKPAPNFTFAQVCHNDTTLFSGTGGATGDTIAKWQWISNPVILGGTKTLAYRFSTPGTHQVTLAVESQNGCFDTITKPVIIYALPVASFYLDPAVIPNDSVQCFKKNKFTFFNGSTALQGQIMTAAYFWGTQQTPGTFSGSRPVPGVFPVKLTIVTNRGCKDSVTQLYKVLDSIAVNFDVATYCLPKPTDFNDSSKSVSGTITGRFWRLGDGTNATGKTVQHTYSTGGNYPITLIITNSEGCTDSLKKNISVTSEPVLNLSKGLNNPLCAGDSFMVNAMGGNYVQWSDGSANRLRYLKTAGKYKVTAFTSAFCFVTDSVELKLQPPVYPEAGKDTSLIRGRYITLKGDGGIKYEWLPRNEVETPDSVRTRVKPQKTTTYYLIVTDGNGCTGLDSVKVFVIEPLFIRIPNMITPNGDGKNDNWDLREVPNIEIGRVTIFNSLGEMVWQLDKGYDHSWVGTDKTGYPLPMGNYLYVIEVPTEKEPFRGYLHIAY